MLNTISQGDGGKTARWRSSILKAWEKKTPKPLTSTEQSKVTQESIEKTSSGQVQQIALKLNQIVKTFKNIHKSNIMANSSHPGTRSAGQVNGNKQRKHVLILMKLFNQFVQGIGKSNLTIDTAKSLKSNKVVPKK